MKTLKRRLSSSGSLSMGSALGWETDRGLVMTNGATFHVKYMGSTTVEKGRGVDVCEQAVLTIKQRSSKLKRKLMLVVRSDSIHAFDEETQEIVVEHPIERVSFCSPFPDHTRLFSYIARDFRSKCWVAYCFYAQKDSGERVCHAMGCAFTVCMRKQQERIAKRNKERDEQDAARAAEKAKRASLTDSTDGASPPAGQAGEPERVMKRRQSEGVLAGSTPDSLSFNPARRRSSETTINGVPRTKATTPTSSLQGLIKPPPDYTVKTSAAETPDADSPNRTGLQSNKTMPEASLISFSPEPSQINSTNGFTRYASTKALEDAIFDVERALRTAKAASELVNGVESPQEAPSGSTSEDISTCTSAPRRGPLQKTPSFDLSHLNNIVHDADQQAKKELALHMGMLNPFAEEPETPEYQDDKMFDSLVMERHQPTH